MYTWSQVRYFVADLVVSVVVLVLGVSALVLSVVFTAAIAAAPVVLAAFGVLWCLRYFGVI